MTVFFGSKRLSNLEDWKGIVGEKKWKKGYSAYELAYAWQTAVGIPRNISKIFDDSGHKELCGLRLQYCFAEKPVFLDSKKAPSVTDLMAYGRNKSGDLILIAVEGKVQEPFGPRVSKWLNSPSKTSRLKFLGFELRKDIRTDSTLCYQLLHRTVSVVLESQLHGAKTAIVLVHAFGPIIDKNLKDYSDFLTWLGVKPNGVGAVSGPQSLGAKFDVTTFFLWSQQPLSTPDF
ncbi:MAG: DUF6946 family protein [Nitrospiria bacterium]